MSEFKGGLKNWFYNKDSLSDFQSKILAWGKENFRSYPWRLVDNPYLILIAEIMLHRTQASQVQRIYEDFIGKYPTLDMLSIVSREKLHKELFSLGLRWRIDRLFDMVKILKSNYDSEIPDAKDDLLSLPGINEYIANAVRCFAWNIPEPLVDTNTIRIIGRLFSLEIKPSSRRNKQFKTHLSHLLSQDYPASFNYALLDLADKVCTLKKKPECSICPVLKFCLYGKNALEEV